MLTRGRLVPRQPRAIKRTTRTELRGKNIHHGGCVHWNIDVKPTLLRSFNIRNDGYIYWNIGITPTALHRYNIHHERCVHWNIGAFCHFFIRMLILIVL